MPRWQRLSGGELPCVRSSVLKPAHLAPRVAPRRGLCTRDAVTALRQRVAEPSRDDLGWTAWIKSPTVMAGPTPKSSKVYELLVYPIDKQRLCTRAWVSPHTRLVFSTIATNMPAHRVHPDGGTCRRPWWLVLSVYAGGRAETAPWARWCA